LLQQDLVQQKSKIRNNKARISRAYQQ